ncbi:uncharacterized protein HD556DRAFT_1266834 [Suillus plorans]|uniref:Uncharacterized protein n=1 Tax=Suillus plorans TaxID=116603 RepID=A0A9P7DMM2_9AGAM|nr:uncharacterized protein HD556DRAFT_1266834 [Suillus plorans]KAG1798543.1 hypothetical protein HD556DRAFT_1266834 [Suillus plorans]
MTPRANDCSHPTAIPPKVDDTFKGFKYVPYSVLTSTARWQAVRNGEEAFTITAAGAIAAKGLDRRNERSITLSDWIGAAEAAEERTEFYHGIARAVALKAHHSVVLGLSRSHSWDFVVGSSLVQTSHLYITCTSPDVPAQIYLLVWFILLDLILSLPDGCVAATFDIASAYRIVPVHPSQQWALCIFWNGHAYVDRALMFGLSSSTHILQ